MSRAVSVRAALVALGALLACEPPTRPGRIRSLMLDVPAYELRPGEFMRVAALPLDVNGELVEGETVHWRSLTTGTLDVSDDGLMLAKRPGVGIARATVGAIHADVQLDLINPPIAQLRIDLDTVVLELPGTAHQLVAKAYDADGIGIVNPALTWEASAPRFASVSAAGVVSQNAVGTSRVTVRAEGYADSVVVVVRPQATANAPVIAGTAPATAVPGQSITVTGTGFAPSAPGNTVLLDGTPATVTAATTTQLTITVPPATSLACQPARDVTLQVGTSGGIAVTSLPLTVVAARTLAVGQSLTFTAAADARCNSFAPAPGRYLISIPNSARVIGAGANAIALSVRGDATGAGAAVQQGTVAAAARDDARAGAREWLRDRRARARQQAHTALLGVNAAMVAAAGAPASRRGAANALLSVPTVGAIVPLRVPAIGQTDLCSSFSPIGARIVHVGEHVVILEDTATMAEGGATLARQMDPDLAAIGAELDTRGWPLVQTFGDPLVMDSRLDDNGRVMVVFTPRMNARLGGAVLASVVTCDFFPRSTFASSNVGEFLYAQVPTTLATGMVAGSRGQWRHEMRATLVHELKHVTSYAERIVRSQPLEEGWLEEATARHAEELYARAAYGMARFGNAGFAATLACELRADDPSYPECADAPRAMRPHVEALWDFLAAPQAHSPLGGDPGDLTYYASAWALTRWLADLEAPSEAAFFTALTVNRQAGIANLEARTGREWEEMLLEWSLAMLSDDLPGFTAQSARLRFPSFDLRSIYQGLCEVAGSCIAPSASPYTRAWPVQPVTVQGGAFDVEFGAIAPGGFAVIELVVPAGISAQSIELRGFRGGPLPTTARLGIVRIQ